MARSGSGFYAALCFSCAVAACSSYGSADSAAGAGSAGTPGVAGAPDGAAVGGAPAGGSGPGTANPSEPSGMPIPTSNGVPRPSGSAGNLTVLNWAGFKASISFSFDDALPSQITHYAELNGTGAKLTFYLISNNNTNPAWTQAAKDGHELGNHTAHHCHDDGTGCATGLYAGSIDAEVDQCTMHLEQQFGVASVWTAASPYGDVGYAVPAATRFLLNRGVQGGNIGPNDTTDPFELPCHVADLGELEPSFDALTDAAQAAGKWQIFLVHSLGGDGGFNPVSISDVVGALNHAKTARDIWSDSVIDVGAYWVAQKLVSSALPASANGAQTWSWKLPEHFPPGHYLRVKVDGGTLRQAGSSLPWSPHGYYEVALDAGSLTLSP